MEIDIRDEQKIVTIWLSKAERNDPGVSDTLRKICAEYNPRSYTVAVFKSGEDDLFELTSDLLMTNRRKLAEQETEREAERKTEQEVVQERAVGPSMTMGF